MIVRIVEIYLTLSLVLWAVWGQFQGGSLCLTSSVCWSLQCLISILTQGWWWWKPFFFRLTCSVTLVLKSMICFSGCLMSSASSQELFCGVCSALKCSFDKFVREKVVSLSCSSTIFCSSSNILIYNRFFYFMVF